MEPGAYEAQAKATAEAEEKNEKAFEQYADEKEKEGLAGTVEFMDFHKAYHLSERMSPLMKLSSQIHGYGKAGLHHDDDIRLDKNQLLQGAAHVFPSEGSSSLPYEVQLLGGGSDGKC